MQKNSFFKKLITELSHRTSDGIPNLSKKEHLVILSEILAEMGLSEMESELIKNLTEDKTEDAKYSHIGGGTYVKKGQEKKSDAQKFTKDDSGNYNVISQVEYEKLKAKAGEEGGPTNNPNAEPKQDTPQPTDNLPQGGEQPKQEPPKGTSLQTPETQKRYKKEAEAATNSNQSTDTTGQPRVSKEDGVTLKRVKEQIDKNSTTFSEEQKKMANDCFELTQKLFDETISDDEKTAIAIELKEKFNITTNASGTKFYINALGGKRKIFGNGTTSTEKLVNQLKKYTQLDQVDFSGLKKNLTAAAKPDLGKDNEVKPKDDARVKELFQSSPVLSRIREGVHGIFAPKDADGNVLFPSNKHPRAYLKQSFENPALNKTIELAQEYADKGLLSQEYVDALKAHQKRLAGILGVYEIPSEEAASAIADSYNDLMVDLNNADPEAASAVMKQLAENRLYEEALARGEEVYLPSNGSFPGGDMIRVGGDDGEVETVSLVSCKFGKEGRIYGCPANMKAVTQLHPDPAKRDIFGQYVGEKGFTMMIKDELIKGETKEETTKKIEGLLKKSLLNQNLSDTFSDEELAEISTICSDYFYKLNELRNKLEIKLGNVSADTFWAEYQKELSKFKKEFQQKIQKIVTPEKLEKIVGKNNVPNFKTRLTPDVFLSGVLLAENIRTSDGYGLSHNKQFYDENGTPVSKTDKGTNNPDDYSLTIRNERTAGRNGGGIQMSFTGDGERPNGELLPMES
jgi:hypothetical protein